MGIIGPRLLLPDPEVLHARTIHAAAHIKNTVRLIVLPLHHILTDYIGRPVVHFSDPAFTWKFIPENTP